MNSTEIASARAPYKRKVRNYLLDVGLQLRYTATIVIVAVFLTAGLGYKMWQATRDVSRVILWTSLVDPSSAEELQAWHDRGRSGVSGRQQHLGAIEHAADVRIQIRSVGA